MLLVEDDDTLRGVIAMHLEHEGMQVHSVDDGNAALSAFRETAPDILVLDVMLPGLSGLEVAARVREETQPSPGIVMITALGGEDDVVNGFRAGADDYVAKPLRPRELRYAPAEGTIRVETGVGSVAFVVVEDDGPGVPDEELEKLGERFHRPDPSRSRRRGGHGLGLAIVLAIAHRHGGAVIFDRSALGGLCVRVELPPAG